MTMTLIIFTICSLVNVMLNTVKTIVMYKKNILSSSFINAITYGFYTVIVVLMAGEMPLGWKIALTAITNFVGVALSMKIMARLEKDKLWLVQMTSKTKDLVAINDFLNSAKLPYSYIIEETKKYVIYNIYCETQKESSSVKELTKRFNVKYFVSESKTL